MKIYIACPMTGFENFNRHKILRVAGELERKGYTAVHTADLPDGWDYMKYIRTGLDRLFNCDAIYLMQGWHKSNGVINYEMPLASSLGLEVFEQGTTTDILGVKQDEEVEE